MKDLDQVFNYWTGKDFPWNHYADDSCPFCRGNGITEDFDVCECVNLTVAKSFMLKKLEEELMWEEGEN